MIVTEMQKRIACEFAKFLITRNVIVVDYKEQTYRTNTGVLASDMQVETMEKIFDRFIENFKP